MRKAVLAFLGAAFMAASPASAAMMFELIDYNGSVRGTPAEDGFRTAANYWSSVLTNDITIRLEIGYTTFDSPSTIGSTGSTAFTASTVGVYQQLDFTGDSRLDDIAVANLTPLSAAGGIRMITSGYDNDATKVGIDVTKQVYDADDSTNNTRLRANSAVFKALGFTGIPSTVVDGRVNFNNRFAFDFNPLDGITRNAFDFIGVAIHEIGHALGFTSGVDIYDNPANVNNANLNANGIALFSTLDLFRYSNDPRDLAPGTGPVLDLAVGSPTYFSIDGGATQLFGDSRFSTGRNFGDGQQASHFKDATSCAGQLGILDPTLCRGTLAEVTALDLAAFDAMGYNLNVDVLANPGYRVTTAQIFQVSGVPEPTTWAMMLIGFGAIGHAVRVDRRRKRATA